MKVFLPLVIVFCLLVYGIFYTQENLTIERELENKQKCFDLLDCAKSQYCSPIYTMGGFKASKRTENGQVFGVCERRKDKFIVKKTERCFPQRIENGIIRKSICKPRG